MIKRSIYFIRHGQKEPSETYNSLVNKKLRLTKQGRLQSRSTGVYLKEQEIDLIYSSDYVRALQTASIANERLQIDVRTDSRFGERVLLVRAVDAATSKREFDQSQNDWSYHTDGGESLRDVIERFERAIDAAVRMSPGDIAIFTHGRALQSYLSHVFPKSGFDGAELVIEPCDVYRIDYEDNSPVVWSFVFTPAYFDEKNDTIETLADTVVIKRADKRILEKTHIIGAVGHNIQANLYEKRSLDILHSIGVPVPSNRLIIDRGKYMSMNYISGKTLGSMLSNSERAESHLRKLGKILRDFHDNINGKPDKISALEVNHANYELNAQCALNFTALTIKNLHVRKNDPLYNLFVDAVRIAEKAAQRNPQYMESKDVIYGDFKPDNILINHQNIYMIDPHLSYGRISCDLGKMIARLYLTDLDAAPKNVAALLDGYRPDAYMLQEIRDMAGFDILNTFSRLATKNQLSSKINIPSHRRSLQNMERCLKNVVPALYRNNDILILRHLDDVQDFRVHYRNTPIIDGEEEKVPDIARVILGVFSAEQKKKIHLISSEQIRAKETAQLVVAELRRQIFDIQMTTSVDDRIRDLYHGRYITTDDYKEGEKLPALTIATKAYIDQTFTEKNIDYRNGDPLDGKYPSLRGLFSEYGEAQREFSIRFYDFVGSFLEDIDSNPDTLFVIVAHTAIVFRLYELSYLIKTLAENHSSIDTGKLAFHEWQQVIHLDRNPANQLFIAPGEVKQLQLRGLLGHSWRFRDEVSFLYKSKNL